MRVLVVDDEDDVRLVICELLRNEGYDVTTAANGGEALEHLREEHFDLVTMDLRMPGLSGRDTLSAMRDIAPDALPIVISGYMTPDDEEVLPELGARAVLAKPFDIDQLLGTVAEVLSTR